MHRALSALILLLLPTTLRALSPFSCAPPTSGLLPLRPVDEAVDASWTRSSTYVPVDSWIYPALLRLHALGYLDDVYLGLRPWTRLSIARGLQAASDKMAEDEQQWVRLIEKKGAEPGGSAGEQARILLSALNKEFAPDLNPCRAHAELDSVYVVARQIAGTPLRDSYHLGQTLANDYGRVYQQGFNAYTGASGRAQYGRFSLFVRGEYQHAPAAPGYSQALSATLSENDLIPFVQNPLQDLIPLGPIKQRNLFRIQEANASFRLSGHEFSFGKSDHWMGPASGGAFVYSSNAENIYAFQVDRSDPLTIPLLSHIIGPVRYDFFVGSLKGHADPNDPWLHVEKLSFKPTRNTEFGFERTVIWGGRGHEPITVKSFLRSFFSIQNVTAATKFSRVDPGARFSAFDFSWRPPLVRDWITLYTDALAHDDVNPISAPRRAGIRAGVYLSHVPGAPRLDLRVEGANTDPGNSRSTGGFFLDWEAVQKQGTTNKGLLFGDAIGRENKGGNVWLTWHATPEDQLQLSWRGVKAAKDFIPGGTTQNQFRVDGVRRFGKEKNVEARFSVQYEAWKAPIYRVGGHSDVTADTQITWYPKLQWSR